MTSEEHTECTGFHESAITQAVADCADFQKTNETDLLTYYALGHNESQAGIDFYLTRNGHGAGFWDRGDDPIYRRLTRAAKAYGEADCMYDSTDKMLFFG